MKIKKVVPWEAEGIRLDRFLSTLLPETHISTLRWLIRDGRVSVDGRLTLRQLSLRPHALVEVKIPEGEELRTRKEPPARAPEVLYADEACLVVDKPAGVPVIPERFREVETLRDLIQGGEKLRIVHRLDRDTSGCLLLARTREAQRALSQQFRERGIEKVYLALVRGRFPLGRKMDVERAIGPDMRRRGRMRVVPAEEIEKHPRRPHKDAFTRLEGKEQFRGYALVEARPRTGRTHQVRVHLASIGLPLVGDRIYAPGVDRGLFLSEFKQGYKPKPGKEEVPLLGRLALHALELKFRSPATGEFVTAKAGLPRDFDKALARLRHFAGLGPFEGGGLA